MILFTDIKPHRVIARLVSLTQNQRQINEQNGVQNISVQWSQLSIIFCETSDPENPNSTVRFWDPKDKTTTAYQIDSSVLLREHLLFVHYSPLTLELRVFGDLTHHEYQYCIGENSHLTLYDIAHEDVFLTYRDNPWELKWIKPGRDFVNYTGFREQNPNYIAESIGLARRIELLQESLDEVVFGLNLTNLRSEELYDYLIHLQFECSKEDRALKFYYGCLLSAMVSSFQVEFEQVQVAKLSELFGLFYSDELKRTAFCQLWLPRVQIIRSQTECQFHRVPPECSIRTTDEPILKSLHTRHKVKYPGTPFPAVYFRTWLINAPALLTDLSLPVHNGQVCFTHHELFHFVESQLLKAVRLQVAFLRDRFNMHIYEQYIIPMVMQRRWNGTAPSQLERMLTEQNSEMKPDFLSGLMYEFQQLLKLPKPSLLRDYTIPLLAGLNNCLGLQDRERIWPRRRTLDINDDAIYLEHPELELLHQELPPNTYEDLVTLSERYWAPCMQKMSAKRVGSNHMPHSERVRMAALIRVLGYREEQGLELWRLLFERTTVYTGPTQFFQTSQGLVIIFDYRRNRTENIGVSCRALISNKFCPFVSEGHGDIEEVGCQAQCRATFHSQNTDFMMPFPKIKSPRDYFFQARSAIQVVFDEEDGELAN